MFEIILNYISELLLFAGYIGGGSFPKPLSNKEEEKYLELFSKGDKEARRILIEHNLRLVAHVAKKYSNENDFDDLVSVGTIGLIKGINTFNAEKSPRLSTYIARCIENEILMVMRSGKKRSSEISLDETIGCDREGNNMMLSDILAADNSDVADEVAFNIDVNRLYKCLSSVLSESELEIIVKRYGLQNQRRRTQQEVAEDLGISRSYVSRIEKRAIGKLRKAFEGENR